MTILVIHGSSPPNEANILAKVGTTVDNKKITMTTGDDPNRSWIRHR